MVKTYVLDSVWSLDIYEYGTRTCFSIQTPKIRAGSQSWTELNICSPRRDTMGSCITGYLKPNQARRPDIRGMVEWKVVHCKFCALASHHDLQHSRPEILDSRNLNIKISVFDRDDPAPVADKSAWKATVPL